MKPVSARSPQTVVRMMALFAVIVGISCSDGGFDPETLLPPSLDHPCSSCTHVPLDPTDWVEIDDAIFEIEIACPAMGAQLRQWYNETVMENGMLVDRFQRVATTETDLYAIATKHSTAPTTATRDPRFFINTTKSDYLSELVNTLRHEYGHIDANTTSEAVADEYMTSCGRTAEPDPK